MPWTAPKTWNTGDVLPASDMNTYVRDNTGFFMAGTDLASAASLVVTNASHLVTGTTTIDNISPTSPVKGQPVKLIFQSTITVRNNGGGTGNIRLTGTLHGQFVAGESVELVYDGALWQEVHRSPLHLSGQEVNHAFLFTHSGYLVEDGSAISRTTYAGTFANMGTIHGVGDGSTTFNIPDSRGRDTIAYASGGHADVATVGLTEGGALATRRPKHKHTNTANATSNAASNVNGGGANNVGGNTSLVNSGSAGAAFPVTTNVSTTPTVTVGPQTGNEPTDSAAYIVKPRYVRV